MSRVRSEPSLSTMTMRQGACVSSRKESNSVERSSWRLKVTTTRASRGMRPPPAAPRVVVSGSAVAVRVSLTVPAAFLSMP